MTRTWQDIEWDLYNVRASLNTTDDILSWTVDPQKRAYFAQRRIDLDARYRSLNAELTRVMLADRRGVA